MSVIQVTRMELMEHNLVYLIRENTEYRKKASISNGHYHIVSEMYYWDTREKEATLCMLAGIGRIIS